MLSLRRTTINGWWKVFISMIFVGNREIVIRENGLRIVIYFYYREHRKNKISEELMKTSSKPQKCLKKTQRNIKSSNSLHHLYLTPTRKHKPKDEGIFSHSKKNLLYYNQSDYKRKICNKDVFKMGYSAQKFKPRKKVKQRKFLGKSLYSDSFSKKK